MGGAPGLSAGQRVRHNKSGVAGTVLVVDAKEPWVEVRWDRNGLAVRVPIAALLPPSGFSHWRYP